jgi:uncharacterized protein
MALQEKMHELFLLDQQVRGLRSRVDAAEGRLRSHSVKLEQLERQHQELVGQYKHVQVLAADLENQVQSAEQRINHLREQMNSVKSNKEYSALLIEVSTLKNERGKLEEQALVEMERQERIKEEVEALHQRVLEQQKTVEVARQEVGAAQAEVRERLDEVSSQRDQAEKNVPLEARTLFRRLADIHDGEALATVVEENRRHMEYSCGGCYMSIPIERVNTLMMRPDEMSCCPSCGRILYMDQELRATFAKA